MTHIKLFIDVDAPGKQNTFYQKSTVLTRELELGLFSVPAPELLKNRIQLQIWTELALYTNLIITTKSDKIYSNSSYFF